jgi:hypothetical protein
LGGVTSPDYEGADAHFSMPLSRPPRALFAASGIGQIGFQNSAGQAVAFCLDEVAITSGSSGSASVGRRHLS